MDYSRLEKSRKETNGRGGQGDLLDIPAADRQERLVAAEREAHEDADRHPSDHEEHGVVDSYLAPFLRVRAPGLVQARTHLGGDVVGEAVELLRELVLDDLRVHGVLDQVRLEKGVVGLEELAVDVLLAQHVVGLRQKPRDLRRREDHLWAVDEVG